VLELFLNVNGGYMKSTVCDRGIGVSLPYPKLMQDNVNRCVVLFTGPGRGVCVGSGGSLYSVGEGNSGWNELAFSDFHGSVTISN
jgi:hypothetical protein